MSGREIPDGLNTAGNELIADLRNDNWTVRDLVHKVNNFIL